MTDDLPESPAEATEAAEAAEPADAPGDQAPAREPFRFGWLDGLVVFACSLLMAPAFGFLWHAIAPRVPVQVGSDGLDFLNAEPGQFFDADGTFAVIGFCIGIVIGVLVCLRWRQLPLGVILGATFGGLVGSIIAVWLGQSLGPTTVSATGHALGTVLHAPLKLRSHVFVLAWPTGVLLVLLGVTAWRDDRRGLSAKARSDEQIDADPMDDEQDHDGQEGAQPASSATSPSE